MTLPHEKADPIGKTGHGVGEYRGNLATIYSEAVYMKARSEQEGRNVYDDFDFIRIVTPGQKHSTVQRKLTEDDKRNYPDVWKAYKEQSEVRQTGTALSELPGIRKSRLLEMQAGNIRTIEALVDIGDSALKSYGHDVIMIKRQAEKWLSNNDSGKVQVLEDEISLLKEQAEKDTEEIEKLSGQVRLFWQKTKPCKTKLKTLI